MSLVPEERRIPWITTYVSHPTTTSQLSGCIAGLRRGDYCEYVRCSSQRSVSAMACTVITRTSVLRKRALELGEFKSRSLLLASLVVVMTSFSPTVPRETGAQSDQQAAGDALEPRLHRRSREHRTKLIDEPGICGKPHEAHRDVNARE